jgi:hypothetical protein
MYGSAMKDDAKKEGLMELIKKMYSMMDKDSAPDPSPEHEALETPDEETSEHETGLEAMDEGKDKSLMSKAMGKSEDDDGFDIEEIKDFLTKKRKAPVGKALSIMAVEKASAPKMKFEKAKKY